MQYTTEKEFHTKHKRSMQNFHWEKIKLGISCELDNLQEIPSFIFCEKQPRMHKFLS